MPMNVVVCLFQQLLDRGASFTSWSQDGTGRPGVERGREGALACVGKCSLPPCGCALRGSFVCRRCFAEHEKLDERKEDKSEHELASEEARCESRTGLLLAYTRSIGGRTRPRRMVLTLVSLRLGLRHCTHRRDPRTASRVSVWSMKERCRAGNAGDENKSICNDVPSTSGWRYPAFHPFFNQIV